MSSGVRSPLFFNIIALSLTVLGLAIVGLVSGLIPGMIPGKPGADESAMQVEAKAEAPGTTSAAIGNLVGTVSAKPEVAADQAGNSTAARPVLMVGAKKP